MKKLLSLVLAIILCLSLAPSAFAAGLPAATAKTYTLDAAHISNYGLEGDVSVKVTLTGYLGELDMEECGISNQPDGPIYVLKSGSDVKFTITSSDPDAYYNFCYDVGEFDMYTFDDWGGGIAYQWWENDIDRCYMSVFPNGDGTAYMVAGGFTSPDARKINDNTYAYTATDGLYSFEFTAKDSSLGYYDNTDALARYNLGTFLFISNEQVAELKETGTMTFYKQEQDWYQYQHYYPGLAELLGMEEPEQSYVPEEPPSTALSIRFDDGALNDVGISYIYTLTNNTNETINGYYALLSYYPEYNTVSGGVSAQLYTFDIVLQPGASYTGTLESGTWRLSQQKLIWIRFDDKAERDAFLSDPVLIELYGRYRVNALLGEQWLKDNFNITMEPAE